MMRKLFKKLKQITLLRLRFINIKALGNIRCGYYQEYSMQDIVGVLKEATHLMQHTEASQKLRTEILHHPHTDVERNSYTLLARLCQQYYLYENGEKLQKKVFEEVDKILQEWRSGDEAWIELEEVLNSEYDNIMCRLRCELPQLKEEEYRLYSCVKAGFSATTIAVLLGKEKSVVYNRISRLKRKIASIKRLDLMI